MTLFNKIRGARKTLASMLLAGTMAIAGCGGSGGGGGDDPVNKLPVFTSTPITTATEESPYTYNVTCTDADGDDLTFSLPTAVAGMSITKTGANTATISLNADDTISAATHPITVRVNDGKADVDQNYSLNIVNVEDIGGFISDAETGNSIQSIDVTVGSNTASSDVIGKWSLNNVPDGDYQVMIKDPASTYETFKPGFFRVSKTSKLEQNAALYRQADRGFVNDTIRSNGEVRKWKAKPKFRIYTKEVQGGGDVAPATVTAIKDAIKTELNQFNQDGFTDFADPDIEEVATLPTIGVDNGYIKVYWDNANVGGGNNSEFSDGGSGNEIIGSYVTLNTATGKPVHLQELTECLIGGGETNVAAYSTSVLYDPVTAILYSNKDLMLSKLVYNKDLQRIAGNKDLVKLGLSSDPDDRDVNPSTHQWNQNYSAPMSASKLVAPASVYDSDCPKDETYSAPYVPAKEEVNEVF